MFYGEKTRGSNGGEPEVLPHAHKFVSFSEPAVQPGVEPEVAMPSRAKPAFARSGGIRYTYVFSVQLEFTPQIGGCCWTEGDSLDHRLNHRFLKTRGTHKRLKLPSLS